MQLQGYAPMDLRSLTVHARCKATHHGRSIEAVVHAPQPYLLGRLIQKDSMTLSIEELLNLGLHPDRHP